MDTFASILTHPLVQRLGWALLHSLWQGLLASLLLGFFLFFLRRRSAGVRYLCSCTALVLALAMPTATLFLVHVPHHAAWTPPAPSELPLPSEAPNETPAYSPGLIDTSIPPRAMPPSAVIPVAPTTPSSVGLSERLEPYLPWAVLLWLVGVCTLSLRLLGGWVKVQQIKRRCVQPAAAHWQEMLEQLMHQLRISRPVRLLESALVQAPAAIGWLKPVILLPACALTGLTPDQLRMILAHELAHIRRYDYLVNLLQTVVETLLFYHPAVWWISRRIRAERENCCDDIAVAAGGRPLDYARALTELESLRSPSPSLVAAAGGGSLFERIHRILNIPTVHANHTGRSLAGVVLIVSLLTVGIVIRLYADGSSGNSINEINDASKEQNTYQMILPNGTTVDLFGVSYHPSADGPWWSPDGTRLHPIPYDEINGGGLTYLFEHVPRKDMYEFAIRMDGLPKGPIYTAFETNFTNGAGTGCPLKDDQPLANWRALANWSKKKPPIAVLRFAIAAGPWRTIKEILPSDKNDPNLVDPSSAPDSYAMGGVKPQTEKTYQVNVNDQLVYCKVTEYRHPNASARNKPNESDSYGAETWIEIQAPHEEVSSILEKQGVVSQFWHAAAHRVIALDKKGGIHEAVNANSYRIGLPSIVRPAIFLQYDMSLNEIDRFLWQSCPYEWIEFRNISLHPGQKTNVQISILTSQEAAMPFIKIKPPGWIPSEETNATTTESASSAQPATQPTRKKITGAIEPLNRLSDKSPGQYRWRIRSEQPFRLVHGWLSIVDGRIAEKVGDGVTREAESNVLELAFSRVIENGLLEMTMSRSWSRANKGQVKITDQATGKTNIPDQDQIAEDYFDQNGIISGDYIILWQCRFIRNGKVVKHVAYAARLALNDDPVEAFDDHEAQLAFDAVSKKGWASPIPSTTRPTNDDPSSEQVLNVTFRDAGDLNQLVRSGGNWKIENNELLGTCGGDQSWATVRTSFKRISSVLIRGQIVPPSTQNFRVWVGPVHLIFNWEMADQNHYRTNQDLTVTQPHALTAGQWHDIEFKQKDSEVVVTVDGKTVYQTTAELTGTISVQAAWNSTIAVQQMRIVGEPDPAVTVVPLSEPLPKVLTGLREPDTAARKPKPDLSKCGTLTVKVSDHDGEPAKDVSVLTVPADQSTDKPWLVQTNAEGIFSSDRAPAGRYTIVAFKGNKPPVKGWTDQQGYLMGAKRDVRVTAGETTTVQLQPPGSATLDVTLAKPDPYHLEWGIVFLALSRIELPGEEAGKPAAFPIPADLLGMFFVEPGKTCTIHNLPEGLIHVRATPSDPGPMDFSPSTPVEIKASRKNTLDLQLTPRNRFEGKLEFDKEIKIGLSAPAGDTKDGGSLLTMKFSRRDNQLSAEMKLGVISWPKTKWRFTVDMLDSQGKVLKTIQKIFENSGIALGFALLGSEKLELNLGPWSDVSAATRFAVSIEQISTQTATQPAAVPAEFDSNQRELFFHGLDLSEAPVETNVRRLPDLWHEVPPGSVSYEIRPEVQLFGSGLDGVVYWLPDQNMFYVQHDHLPSSILHYYGPFRGDPRKILNLPSTTQPMTTTDEPPWGEEVEGIQIRLQPEKTVVSNPVEIEVLSNDPANPTTQPRTELPRPAVNKPFLPPPAPPKDEAAGKDNDESAPSTQSHSKPQGGAGR